jgi:predicted lipid carrier protein YhbT/chorismate mutase
MKPPRTAALALDGVRHAIDAVDDGLIVLLAARARLVRTVAQLKKHGGQGVFDAARETQVRERAQALAARLAVPAATARGVLDLAIGDARRAQGLPPDVDQGGWSALPTMMPSMDYASVSNARAARLLRVLPPPARIAPLLRLLPRQWSRRALEVAMARVLDAPLREGAFDFMRGRRLGIEVPDLGLAWVIQLHEGRLRTTDEPAEASVRGSATDLLLLASRLEDADTLFFQRRLVVTGDTELGLTARNLLDRLPWESVPLGLRIALDRGARLARAAREAHRGGARSPAAAPRMDRGDRAR